jgi:two-component system cell cycle sensor histidine kinase PleC
MMEDCQRLLGLRADAKSLKIIDDLSEDMPRLWAEKRAVRQICLNLLSNAIKFTPQNGVITLQTGITRHGEQYLSVKDSGPGIPQREIPRVMSPFGQGSLAAESPEGGSGLGLPIVKGLTELHGGRMELRSKPRQGTEVRITFPRKRIMLPAEAVKNFVRLPVPPTSVPVTLRAG